VTKADGDSADLDSEIARIQALIRSPQMRELRARNNRENRTIRPRNAATLVVVDGERGNERVLMGRRNRALKFMPGALVFPGGAVDASDARVATADRIDAVTAARIEAAYRGRPGAGSARALAIASVRELAEETGILIGTQSAEQPAARKTVIPAFASSGVLPAIGSLRLLARAITPPGPPRRFDTWFFVARSGAIAHYPENGFRSSGELEELRWIRPAEAIRSDTREITRVILVELMRRLSIDPELSPACPSPCYRSRRGTFTRTMI
jgi:8-oxo-dGTP pyrophosphatase MutT (NUDIX family)